MPVLFREPERPHGACKTGDLLVHMNRGARIVLGMGKGFYPGYTEEVHEIYRYSMEAKQPPRR